MIKKTLLSFILLISSLFADTLFQEGNEIVTKGKGVIMVFESSTCPYCELLKKDFKQNKEMNALAKEFNIHFINKEIEREYSMGEKKRQETTTTLKMAFMAKNTPNIVIFDKHWNKIFQLPGYAHPGQMITLMKFVKGLHEGKYKPSEWKKFLNDNGVG